MNNDGLEQSPSDSEQQVVVTEGSGGLQQEGQEQEQEAISDNREEQAVDASATVNDSESVAQDAQQVSDSSHGVDDEDKAQTNVTTAAAENKTSSSSTPQEQPSSSTSTSLQDAAVPSSGNGSDTLPSVQTSVAASTEDATTDTSNTDTSAAKQHEDDATVAPAVSSESATTPSIETDKPASTSSSNLEAVALTPSTSNAGSSSTAPASTTTTTKAAAPPKKFTSSLSMNKKFLEKAGATDSKSPQPASASIPKVGTSPATRSPALASPGIPAHPGTSASPPITASSSASSSHPRLLTGKLSHLASGSGSGSTPPPASATWGRPGLATGVPTGAAFGKGGSGFVPAATVGGGPPGSAGPRLGGPPGPQQSLGRMRGAFGQQGRAGHAPWAAGTGRNATGFSRGGSLDQDFPSFQEAARAEEQRQHALLAKERAEKMAAVAQAAYNQRVLEGLKSFSGEYTSSTTHWDELDDDDDDLGDVLEFADGTRYEVPQSATLPTEAEAAAFQQAAQAEKEAAALDAQYRESLAREQNNGDASSGAPSPVDKAERFVDDFDRGEKKRAPQQPEAAAAPPPAGRQPASGRTLFNDRLGRFEPYAGRAPPAGKKERKSSPPAILQRPSRGALSPQDQARPPPQRVPSATQQQQQPSSAGKAAKTPLSPTTLTKGQAPSATKAEVAAPPRKVESPWAKLPPVQQQPIPTQATAPATTKSDATPTSQPTPAAATTQSQQPATPATPAPAAPQTPAEDPEEAYKRQMRSIAEQARKRRQEEEAEREAQVARAKKKAQEIEEKMKAAQKEATPAPTPTSAKPTPTAILSPPASKSDRQANWRRPSIDVKSPQDLQQQSTQQSTSQQSAKPVPSSQARQEPSDRKMPPTPASEPRSIASRQQDKPDESQKQSQAGEVTVDQKTGSSLSTQQKQAPSQAEAEEPTSPPAQAPRVRLGRRLPTRDANEGSSQPPAFGVPHAFPQPTILVGRNSRATDSQHEAQPVSALDKIMSQVRAAQDDLKTRQAAAAMLEEEKRKMQGSSKEDFDGALDRISKALSQANIRSKGRDNAPPSVRMTPTVVEETFDITIPERPQSPRVWQTYNVKVPSVMRSEVRDLPAARVRAFEDPYFPPPIFSSSWIPPKGVRLPRNTTLEEYLFGTEDTTAPPRVKMSKFYPASAPVAEEAPAASTSTAIPPPDMSSRTSLQSFSNGIAVDNASLDSDAFIRTAPMDVDEEEAIATVPFEEEDEEEPAVIKVSLPKPIALATSTSTQSTPVTSQEAVAAAVAHEAGRFKTYGPKLPENSTVAFRRGISPSKALDAGQISDRNIFMVNSELNSNGIGDSLPSFMRSYDQQVMDEVSAPSRAFAAVSSAQRSDLRPSPPSEPVFPSLSPGVERANDETGSQSSFSGMRREELPRHVIAELERLNATVSATPLTNPPRLDSPATLLAGRSTSPWAMGNKASMVPSALSLSAIDPSMSVWSKPTEETAAAAAAAFNSASKDAANDSVQENSLKDLVDDYPSSMPSNAMDLPISDGERPQSKDSSSHQRRSPSETRGGHDRRGHAMSISQVMSSSSNPPSMPLTGRSNHRDHHQHQASSATHGSFSFSPSTGAPQGYPVEGSPYAMSAQLPYSTAPAGMHPQAVYSPGLAQQYGGYVSGSYATGYSSANGMPIMSPAYATASPYAAVPVSMASQDGRTLSSQSYGQNGSVWMPGTAMSGMNGSFTSGASMSPYGSGAISSAASAGGQVYGGSAGYSGKSRMHSSPLYGGGGGSQQRSSPIGGGGGSGESHYHQQQQQQYSSYGYPGSGPSSAIPSHSPRHPYSAFSPRLASPGVQGGYGTSPNGSMSHLRSASAQHYGGRRQFN